MPKECWCGNLELFSYSEDYNRCDECHTLVSTQDIDDSIYDIQNEAGDLYGENYWKEHFLKLAKVSSLAELHDIYLSHRCIYWLQYLLKYSIPPATIADIGCGIGQMPYLIKQAGFKQIGVELSPKVCEYAQNTFNVDMLFGTIDGLSEKYDAILFLDLIEHILKPLDLMQNVIRLSHSETILLIQTPCYNPELSFEQMQETSPNFENLLIPNEHIYIFSHRSMERLLCRFGFSYYKFLPAVFGDDYDMFLVASQSPLVEHDQRSILDALSQHASGWLVRALFEVYDQLEEYKGWLTTSQQREVEKQAFISEQQEWINKQDSMIVEKDTYITEQQTQITKQQTQITKQQTQITKQQTQITEQQSQITEQQSQITEQQSQINMQHEIITSKDEIITELQIQSAIQHAQIEAFFNSTSWKLTKPIRYIGKLIKRQNQIEGER